MAEIIQEEGKQKGGKKKAKKFSTNIDMTPMVDLMCLLITFFMLTTAFSKPKAMEITMPEKKNDPSVKAPEISADRTMNILISGNDQIYYFFGMADPKKPLPQLIKTDYSKDGIRKVLLQRNKIVFKAVTDLREKVLKGELVMADTTVNRKIKELKKSDKNAPIILIKADDKAKYKNLVDIIDEMAITNIANYAIVDMAPTEKQMLESAAANK
ncbi:MAG: biopolymer transporter ExbD [Bacteroidetes bacterium]|nr:biopolymer transporter ExbD [Bacteroidota bacterium]